MHIYPPSQDVLEDIERKLSKLYKDRQTPKPSVIPARARLLNHSHAYKASYYPGAKLISETAVHLEVDNIFDIHRALAFML